MIDRQQLAKTKRWVVKIGSALLTDDGVGLDKNNLRVWVNQIADLIESGHEVVVVSSGAVAEGMSRMAMKHRPHSLHDLQAAAAIGQMGLVQAWESCFQSRGKHTAQVLLTHDDLANRQRYLNARSTLRALVKMGVVPVVNENDVVANDELRFGDNDTLAAMVANLLEADLLVLLTDQEGLYDADPRSNPDASLISQSPCDASELDKFAGDGAAGALGSGGMATKLRAARLAARSGAATLIASGRRNNVLQDVAAGRSFGTLLVPTREREAARKHWLASQMQSRGKLVLDDGAVSVLRRSGKSLLAVGVVEVSGDFRRGELVVCVDKAGVEVARGLVNYGSRDAEKIMRHASSDFEEILGYIDDDELIHRDNLVVV